MYFQTINNKLLEFWQKQGCICLQPYDIEVGAGTSHTATVLRCLDRNKWNVVYVQPSRRPSDGRYAENPNRAQHFYQMQVIMMPAPEKIQEICIESLIKLGLDLNQHDIRFIESDWENPTLGAWGVGWEMWCDGMEILQFTYMQQIGNIDCNIPPVEITYGLERLAMYLQNIDSMWDIVWDDSGITYKEIFAKSEIQHCHFNFIHADTKIIMNHYNDYINEADRLAKLNITIPAYEYCLKASHMFNLLDARGVIGSTDRPRYITDICHRVRMCCAQWINK
ncbi:glycine--tRNA ligase subunit alpha [Lyticum sinuosum]|uniref:Glycine--tRNA ligase alpha subunit n=1 Tax=Lyticum sinuosum TaxID=1332059 RepID=A0AAE5AH02_9RICK|nr:glycine--tRNA ligase subunit alpha [Lyticum sinuosum]MDZ5760995.1 Glycine--tRNA ligase alpha subunit [Lyticum sinuosum]